MKNKYYVEGLHCDGCAKLVERTVQAIPGVTSVHVDLASNIAEIETVNGFDMTSANLILATVNQKKKYVLSKKPNYIKQVIASLKKFAPLIVMFGLVILYTLWNQVTDEWSFHTAMEHFMGAYFLLFGGLKVLNWKGFVRGYQEYDLLAKKSKLYAYAYPAIEVMLGLAYLIHVQILLTSIVTALIMTIKAYGVHQKLKEGSQIQCACLGGFFNIPLTHFTLFEDVLMAVMAVITAIQVSL